MRPFNLERAVDGEPVRTKNGLPARVICVDANNPYEGVEEEICVIALVKEEGFEKVRRYNEKGEYRNFDKNLTGIVVTSNPDLDLVMAPQKREGWVNVYSHAYGRYSPSGIIYPTEEAAKGAADGGAIATVKIEWEE